MMKIMNQKKNFIWKVFIVLVLCSILLPGYTVAQTWYESYDYVPHHPAYLQDKNNLTAVQVPLHTAPQNPVLLPTMDLNITEILHQVDEPLIVGYLENLTSFGPRLTGTIACNLSAQYIYQTFQNMGLDVRYHNYTDNTVSGCNIEATLHGTDSGNIFLICGHYDSVAAGPGADDDGSGVAAVLAAAEVMRNYEFYHTIRFVTFSGEEQGMVGSRHYVEDAYTNNDTIFAVLNADMIGFATSPTDGSKGKIYENDASEWIVTFTQLMSQLYYNDIGIELAPQGETWGSDHYYFWQYGYDAVFYHEYHFNTYYHSANDTIERMKLSYSTRFTRLIIATLAAMASQPLPILEISSITGGFGVTTQIRNSGDMTATDVNVTLSVIGGVFKLLNVSTHKEVTVLGPLESFQVKAMLFRIGNINIAVTAEASNVGPVSKHATAFLLGPFVLNVAVSL
jgi:aminopeptidase YwaD